MKKPTQDLGEIDDAPRRFFVAGIPKTKGSGRGIGFMRKHGPKAGKIGVAVVNDNKLTKFWEAMIHHEAQAIAPRSGVWAERPVALVVTFFLPRPKSRYARDPARPWKKPDLDKLLRAVKDALRGVIYKDDAMVVEVLTKKFFSDRIGVEIDARCL